MTSSWFFLSTLNYDARSTTHRIYYTTFWIHPSELHTVSFNNWVANTRRGTADWGSLNECRQRVRRNWTAKVMASHLLFPKLEIGERDVFSSLAAFEKFRKVTFSFSMSLSVCPLVFPSTWRKRFPTWRIFIILIFEFFFFEKSVGEKFNFD